MEARDEKIESLRKNQVSVVEGVVVACGMRVSCSWSLLEYSVVYLVQWGGVKVGVE
jgi:hypothetical protein